jgi:hypothetical protein
MPRVKTTEAEALARYVARLSVESERSRAGKAICYLKSK